MSDSSIAGDALAGDSAAPFAQTLRTYQPSGQFGWRACVVNVAVGAPLAVLLGWGLSEAQLASSSFLRSAITLALASFIVAFCWILLAERAKSRSPRFNMVAASALILVLELARWAFTWQVLSLDIAAVAASIMPMDALTEELKILGEGFCVGLLPVVVARAQATEPYCEVSQAWAVKDVSGEVWCTGERTPLLRCLSDAGVATLLAMPRADVRVHQPDVGSWQTLFIHGLQAKGASEGRWLTLSLIQYTCDARGKVSTTVVDILKHWQVSSGDYARVAEHLTSAAVPMPPVADRVYVADARPASDRAEAHDADGADEQENETERPTPPQLLPAVSALQAQQHVLTLSLAQPHCQDADLAVQADAWRVCALAHSALKQWSAAVAAFETLFALEPTAFNALQQASTSVMAGELQRGQDWYDKACELNAVSREMPPGRLCTAFLSALEQAGELGACRVHLDWLAQAYRALHNTDDTFVWMRGLPFFGDFLGRSAALLGETCSALEVRDWYAAMYADLDEEGKQRLDAHMAALPLAD